MGIESNSRTITRSGKGPHPGTSQLTLDSDPCTTQDLERKQSSNNPTTNRIKIQAIIDDSRILTKMWHVSNKQKPAPGSHFTEKRAAEHRYSGSDPALPKSQ